MKYGWIYRILLLAVLLCGLSGCGRYPRSQTALLLDNGDKGSLPKSTDGDGYTLQKIYTLNFTSYFTSGCYASILNGEENQVDLFLTDSAGYERRRVDYRYGFYEELPLFTDLDADYEEDAVLTSELSPSGWMVEYPDGDGPLERMRLYLLDVEADPAKPSGLMDEMISPDGKYLLFLDMETEYTGTKLSLVSLESGDSRLLLDGDRDGFSDEEYQIVTAWSRDGGTLCYGYFARSKALTGSDENCSNNDFYAADDMVSKTLADSDWSYFYVMDVESGEIADIMYYAADYVWDFEESTIQDLYVERSGARIMIVVVMGDSMSGNQSAAIFYWDMEGEEGGLNRIKASCSNVSPFILDPERGYCYLTMEDSTQLSRINMQNFTDECVLTADNAILNMIALGDGETFITAECVDGYKYNQSIYLYRCKDGNAVKQTLYLNAPYVKRFQYDPVNRRLLAETDTHPVDNWGDETKTAMVFLFDEG